MWRGVAVGTLVAAAAACASGGHHVAAPTTVAPAPSGSTTSRPDTTTRPRATTTSVPRPSTTTSTRAATTTTRPSSTTAPAPATTTTGAPVTASGGSLAGHVIAIDAGHDGGNAAHASQIARPIWIGTQYRACDTTGTQTADGYSEHAYNLDVALRLRALLAARGAVVLMVRTTDTGWGPCIDERAAIGNRAHAVAAVSIHADGGPTGGRGFHVNMPALIAGYTDDIYGASHRLGVDVRDALRRDTPMLSSTYIGSAGLVERRDFGGLNLSDVPKVLVETGNMRNATDAALLESAAYRQQLAAALADAVARFVAGQ